MLPKSILNARKSCSFEPEPVDYDLFDRPIWTIEIGRGEGLLSTCCRFGVSLSSES